jgi:superfamily II DNA/RNA helicase
VNYFSRLLDLGFEQDLSFILSTIKEHTSRKVQKVLLSATLSQGMTQTNFDKTFK